MQKGVQVSGIDHRYCFLLRLHSLVHEIAGDLQSRRSGSLAVTALQHVQLAILDGKFHILHVMIMIFQRLADVQEVLISLRELLLHLYNRHRGSDTGHHVFALRIGQEFAHQLLLAGCGISGECHTGSGILIQVTEDHRHDIDSGSPGIRDVVVSTIDICSRVVPGTENGFNG